MDEDKSDNLEVFVHHSSNYNIKKKMVVQHAIKCQKLSQLHYLKYRKLKRIGTWTQVIINTLNAVSVSSLVMNLSPKNINILILSLVVTTLSALLSVVMSTYEVGHKIHSHHTSYLQYLDISRDTFNRLRINSLTSKDLDEFLNNINTKLGLIEDQSLPLRLSKSFHDGDEV